MIFENSSPFSSMASVCIWNSTDEDDEGINGEKTKYISENIRKINVTEYFTPFMIYTLRLSSPSWSVTRSVLQWCSINFVTMCLMCLCHVPVRIRSICENGTGRFTIVYCTALEPFSLHSRRRRATAMASSHRKNGKCECRRETLSDYFKCSKRHEI